MKTYLDAYNKIFLSVLWLLLFLDVFFEVVWEKVPHWIYFINLFYAGMLLSNAINLIIVDLDKMRRVVKK